MPDKHYDVIVIGGGMAGAHVAAPLVEAGKEVLMLDGGIRPDALDYHDSPDGFERLRKERESHRLFLGEDLSAVLAASGTSHSSAMVSGNRAYVSAQTAEHLPLDLDGIHVIQSLAKGGLSEAWGAVCDVFTPYELARAGIPPEEMPAAYQEIITAIGISGTQSGYKLQPPSRLTTSMRTLLTRYERLSPSSRGAFVLRPALLALLTEPLGERSPTAYRDLDFYMTKESAIYRARYTIEALEAHENFTYIPGRIARRVEPYGDGYQVAAVSFSGTKHAFFGARVALAAGTINSNRLMLASGGGPVARILLKPDYTLACFDPRLLGDPGERDRISFCQLMLDLPDAEGASSLYANFYNYRSLLLWRLLQYAPLPTPEALSILAGVASAIVLVDVRFPGSEGPCEARLVGETLVLRKGAEGEAAPFLLPKLRRFLRTLGLLPVKTAPLPLGASVHYAGGIATEKNGEVEGHRGLYAADAAGWKALPAKPTALTIMANARRIGGEILRSL